MSRKSDDGGGCAIVLGLLVLAALVMAAISLAALVDPFSWMPPVAEIWEECDDDWETDEDECALATRFDGFWVHAAVNLLYVLITAVVLVAFAGCVGEFRKARRERFSGAEAADR